MKKVIQFKYVPICDRSLQQLIERASNGEPVLDTGGQYGRGGHTPVASLDKIKGIAEKMEDQSGRIISQYDVT
jgi:hypothetical protein